MGYEEMIINPIVYLQGQGTFWRKLLVKEES